MSGTALAAGLGENNRRLAPYRSQNTIFNTNGGEPIYPAHIWSRTNLEDDSRLRPSSIHGLSSQSEAVSPCGMYRFPSRCREFLPDFPSILICRESIRPIIPSEFCFHRVEALDKFLRLDYPVAALPGDPTISSRLSRCGESLVERIFHVTEPAVGWFSRSGFNG